MWNPTRGDGRHTYHRSNTCHLRGLRVGRRPARLGLLAVNGTSSGVSSRTVGGGVAPIGLTTTADPMGAPPPEVSAASASSSMPADKPWDVVSVTRRSSGVAPRACVRVYARVLVPPNLYIHAYIPGIRGGGAAGLNCAPSDAASARTEPVRPRAWGGRRSGVTISTHIYINIYI